MTRRKGKPKSFDAMVKFFMHNYNIPTKRDIDSLNKRLDRIEKLLSALSVKSRRTAPKTGQTVAHSATEIVLDLIRQNPNGIAIADVCEQTGYNDKKLRNIIYRLNKVEKIRRISRGRYKSVE